MECKVLSEPRQLAEFISELDSIPPVTEYSEAFVCIGPSVEEPGRERLWIVPKEIHGGANPSAWINRNAKLFQSVLTRSVVHCSIVFPGRSPAKISHHHIIVGLTDRAPDHTTGAHVRKVRREVRALSANAHLWVDRLRMFDQHGDLDFSQREQLLKDLALRYWNEEQENIYMSPSLQTIEQGGDNSTKAQESLTANRPTCLERGLTVLYGRGGIGKTFLLRRLVNSLGTQARSEPLGSIPAFIQPPPLLHVRALENWLSQHGFDKLTLSQITTLLRWGVIIPVIDALDEVVKGEARQGSNEFLRQLVGLVNSEEGGRGVLACRDYYLNSDTLVPDVIRSYGVAELSFGFFGHQERRRYLQKRTGLAEALAANWTSALEREAAGVLGKGTEEEIEELLGHPVILDALARYIRELPTTERSRAANEFRITSPDIFGQIVEQLLIREHAKVNEAWQAAFHDRLEGPWKEATAVEGQKRVLQYFALLAAADGAASVDAKIRDDESYRQLRHGIFTFMPCVQQGNTPREALASLLVEALGSPEVTQVVPVDEQAATISGAMRHLAEVFASHVLATSEPGLPVDLVFAFVNRVYFDFFLADAFVNQLQHTIANKQVETFLSWCEKHHVFDIFGTCLDFLLWDRRVVRDGMESLSEFLRTAGKADDTLASYLLSLGFALLLRRKRNGDKSTLSQLSFAPLPQWDLVLFRDIIPESVGSVRLVNCTFPKITVDCLTVKSFEIEECDFEAIRVNASSFHNCQFKETECKKLELEGSVRFYKCKLSLDNCLIEIANEAVIGFYECVLSQGIMDQLRELSSGGQKITIENTIVEEAAPPPSVRLSSGRRFINRLMALLRKEGHEEFGVYEYKLRDKTPGTDEQFASALAYLIDIGCIERQGRIIIMTPEGAKHMYVARHAGGEPSYETHREFWEPVIAHLDEILYT